VRVHAEGVKTVNVHELGIGLVITVWWQKHPLTS